MQEVWALRCEKSKSQGTRSSGSLQASSGHRGRNSERNPYGHHFETEWPEPDLLASRRL